MYSRLLKIVNNADSRYLNAEEQAAVLQYAASLPARIEAAKHCERVEVEAIGKTIQAIKRRYPKFESYHQRGWDKTARDMQLVFRYAVQSMILDDAEVGDDKLYVWAKTIIAAFNMTPGMIRDTYTMLRETLRESLPANAYTLLEPHFNVAIESISDFPEPALAAV